MRTRLKIGALCGALLALGGLLLGSKAGGDSRPPPARRKRVPTSEYQARTVEGWTVRVNRRLLNEEKPLGEAALRLLEVKLYDVARAVPLRACAALRKVPIWLGVEDGHAPCAEYHPSREWLERNGYNPDKAKAVEIGSAARFLEWSKEQPSMLLHELAHAYHDQVLGYDHPGIEAAYRRAVRSGGYDAVLHASGKTERHYALSSPQEYFAEMTETLFGTNDYYPFVRAELERHDPEGCRAVRDAWHR